MAFDAEHEAVLATLARRDRLDAAITAMAADSQFTPVVHRLCCLRGISTLTGFGLAVEIGDWHRFTGNTIGAFLGLVPSEHSSGASRAQGPITKTGNTHARRLLVEAAWHHWPQYRIGATMRARWDHAPAAARPARTPATADCTSGGCGCSSARNAPPSPTSLSPASWPGGAGPSTLTSRQRVERSAIHL